MSTKVKRYHVGVMALAVMAPVYAMGHEGHAPLPTKGVEVDVSKGLIILSSEAAVSLGVKTTVVEEKVLDERSLAYAELVLPWQQRVFVSSQLSGRIASLKVTGGDWVAPGQLLAEVTSSDVETLQLNLRNAANALALSERQSNRLRDLAGAQAVPERESIEAATRHAQDKNSLRIAENKLRSLGFSPAQLGAVLDPKSAAGTLRLPIVSPLGGTVNHADLAIGRVVAAHEHLFEVQDVSKLWVKIGVLERDIDRARVGQIVKLTLTTYPHDPVSLTVTRPCVEVDPISHVGTVWAELDNAAGSARYLPGMIGTAELIKSGTKKLLTVPASALLGVGAERFVLVEVAATSKGHEYRRQNVVVVAENSSVVQLRSKGLYPGDRVVSVGGNAMASFFILGSLRLTDEGIQNVGLQMQTVTQHVVEDVLTFDGVIDLPPDRIAVVSSQIAGTLRRVHVDRGDVVMPGQVIAEIAGLPIQDLQLELLESELETTLLDATLKRQQALGGSIMAARRIWELESARNLARNRRESARKMLATLGVTDAEIEEIVTSQEPRSSLPLRASIGGVAVRLMKVLGEGVSEEEPLMEIHDLTHPRVRAFLSEREAPRVPVGTPVRMRLISDATVVATGKVVQSAQNIGIANRALTIWIDFDNPVSRPLQRNLLVQVSAITGQGKPMLAVPKSAILREQAGHHVFVQQASGLLERRVVEIGRSDDQMTEIRHGLRPGEVIAVQGITELQTTFASVR